MVLAPIMCRVCVRDVIPDPSSEIQPSGEWRAAGGSALRTTVSIHNRLALVRYRLPGLLHVSRVDTHTKKSTVNESVVRCKK
jgi:hypothetical protein